MRFFPRRHKKDLVNSASLLFSYIKNRRAGTKQYVCYPLKSRRTQTAFLSRRTPIEVVFSISFTILLDAKGGVIIAVDDTHFILTPKKTIRRLLLDTE